MQMVLLLCALVGLNATEVYRSVCASSNEGAVWREQPLLEAEYVIGLHDEVRRFWMNDQPAQGTDQLEFMSDDLRQMYDEVRRFWMTDQSGHTTYQRIQGGIGP